MSDKVDKLSELEQELLDAAEKAVSELIKVAKAPIIKGKIDMDNDVAVDKLKNAASAKKTAMFDAFDIIDKTRERRKILSKGDGEESEEDKIEKKVGGLNFAEGRAT
jgi:hypothetical protein